MRISKCKHENVWREANSVYKMTIGLSSMNLAKVRGVYNLTASLACSVYIEKPWNKRPPRLTGSVANKREFVLSYLNINSNSA
jgi:hypothetical protein